MTGHATKDELVFQDAGENIVVMRSGIQVATLLVVGDVCAVQASRLLTVDTHAEIAEYAISWQDVVKARNAAVKRVSTSHVFQSLAADHDDPWADTPDASDMFDHQQGQG